MDQGSFSGRSAGYRGIAIRCPGCAESMSARLVDEAEVDVCPACGGMWLDWFDGDVKRLACGVLAADAARELVAGPRSDAVRNEAFATGACPRCTRQLAVERYVVQASVGSGGGGRTLVSQTTGADLLRCEDCAGVFVARSSATLLAALPSDDGVVGPPSSSAARVLDPLPWQRFIALLRKLLAIG